MARKWGGDKYQVDHEGCEDAGDVAHDVDEGDPLGSDYCGEELGGVLETYVVGDVHGEAAHYGEGGRRDSYHEKKSF